MAKYERWPSWHHMIGLATLLLVFAALISPEWALNTIALVLVCMLFVASVIAAAKQGVHANKVRASDKDGARALLFVMAWALFCVSIYGHFHEFSIFHQDLFEFLK